MTRRPRFRRVRLRRGKHSPKARCLFRGFRGFRVLSPERRERGARAPPTGEGPGGQAPCGSGEEFGVERGA